MSYDIHIQHDFVNQRLQVYLLERVGDHRVIHRGDGVMHRLEPATAPDQDDLDHPFAMIPPGAEHALLGALSRHLGAVEHPEQLRRDYDAERRRVDRFIEHLTGGPK